MKIIVTGSSGRVGRYVVRELVEAGHEVMGVDLAPLAEQPGQFLRVDLTQAGEIYQALAGAEAVAHLGAWANAGVVPDTRTYGENVLGTFNIFQACADLGIKRVIYASSAQVYGVAKAPPLYVPVDEDHPLRPANSYALSKIAGEQAAAYFMANRGLAILSFRLMGVRTPEQLNGEIEQLVQNPASGAHLQWTRTDARDAALAFRLALEQETVASGPYNISGPRIIPEVETLSLVKEYYGGRTEIREGLAGHASPLSSRRAEEAFGYRQRYIWSASQRYLEM